MLKKIRDLMLTSMVLLTSIIDTRAEEVTTPPTKGVVVSVHDGDTLTLQTTSIVEGTQPLPKKNLYKIRLLMIDTPELSQTPFGKEVKDVLSKEVLNKEVTIEYEPKTIKDFHGRYLGIIFYNHKNVNLELIKSGNAVPYMVRKYFKYYALTKEYNTYAKNNKLGVFYRTTPSSLQVLPENYRKIIKNLKPSNKIIIK